MKPNLNAIDWTRKKIDKIDENTQQQKKIKNDGGVATLRRR